MNGELVADRLEHVELNNRVVELAQLVVVDARRLDDHIAVGIGALAANAHVVRVGCLVVQLLLVELEAERHVEALAHQVDAARGLDARPGLATAQAHVDLDGHEEVVLVDDLQLLVQIALAVHGLGPTAGLEVQQAVGEVHLADPLLDDALDGALLVPGELNGRRHVALLEEVRLLGRQVVRDEHQLDLVVLHEHLAVDLVAVVELLDKLLSNQKP